MITGQDDHLVGQSDHVLRNTQEFSCKSVVNRSCGIFLTRDVSSRKWWHLTALCQWDFGLFCFLF